VKRAILSIFAFVLVLAGCAHTEVYQLPETYAEGPKIVALQGSRLPWVVEIERRLRKSGFQVLRYESQKSVIKNDGSDGAVLYNESSARYILKVEGAAALDSMNRCMGGGYNFQYITVELIDTRANQTISTYSGSGYSEDCPPLSGKIFSQIEQMLINSWSTK
jgi:hypothetical protein